MANTASSSKKSVRSSCRIADRRLSRCDAPSLVTSTSEDADRYHVISSFDSGDLVGDVVVEQSIETNPDDRSNNNHVQIKTPRKFKRWTSIEDSLLEIGVKMGEGPPHDWKVIAAEHLAGMRSPLQVSLLTCC